MENELQLVNNEERAIMSQGYVMEEDESFIMDLTAPRTTAYSSINLAKASEADKKAYFNAINSSDVRLGDQINKTIDLKNVYVEIVELHNDSGEVTKSPRIVLIDAKGQGYSCVSTGIFSSLKKIFQVFGTPENWDKPIKVEIKQITKGNDRKILTLAIA